MPRGANEDRVTEAASHGSAFPIVGIRHMFMPSVKEPSSARNITLPSPCHQETGDLSGWSIESLLMRGNSAGIVQDALPDDTRSAPLENLLPRHDHRSDKLATDASSAQRLFIPSADS